MLQQHNSLYLFPWPCVAISLCMHTVYFALKGIQLIQPTVLGHEKWGFVITGNDHGYTQTPTKWGDREFLPVCHFKALAYFTNLCIILTAGRPRSAFNKSDRICFFKWYFQTRYLNYKPHCDHMTHCGWGPLARRAIWCNGDSESIPLPELVFKSYSRASVVGELCSCCFTYVARFYY